MTTRKMVNNFSILSNDIGYYVVIYEQKSINGAARKLAQDPGNISRSLAKLERLLGRKLFIRHKNGLSPTPEG